MLPDPSPVGDYDLLSQISQCGLGNAYRARNRTSGEIVALQLIQFNGADPVTLQRVEYEFLTRKAFDHPNVLRAIEFSDVPPFVVTEYVDGTSVGQRIHQRGPYPEAEAVRLIRQVCAAAQFIHDRGYVHCDVRPYGVLVTGDGVAKLEGAENVRRIAGARAPTESVRVMGAPHFMPPELFRGRAIVDARTDIYALGSTLYAMVAGVTPLEHLSPLDCWLRKVRNEIPAPSEVNPAVSARVSNAILRAVRADPAERPSSCAEFLADLTDR